MLTQKEVAYRRHPIEPEAVKIWHSFARPVLPGYLYQIRQGCPCPGKYPPIMLRNLLTAMAQGVRSLMLTLLFSGAVLCGLYLYQAYRPAFEELPVIRELTANYKQGLSTLSQLGLQRYATLSLPERSARAQGLSAASAGWEAEAILAKLDFSKAKKRQAAAFTAYIAQHAPAALHSMAQYKVPASIKLAQALLESNAGRSVLARQTLNHFGIKARASARARDKIKRRDYAALLNSDFIPVAPAIGAWRFHDDHSYDRFETYRNVADSYARHDQLLTRPCTFGRTGCYAWIWEAFPPGQDHDISAAAQAYLHRSGIAPQRFFDGQTRVPYYAACAAGLKMAGYATSPAYHKKITYLIETYELWRFDLAVLGAFSAPEPGT